jgi:ribosomal protein L7/L12
MAYADYWSHFDTIALEHLLIFEEGGDKDRDTALAPRLRDGWSEVRALLRSGRTIEAIKLYRERTGLGLREARDAVEAMRGDP